MSAGNEEGIVFLNTRTLLNYKSREYPEKSQSKYGPPAGSAGSVEGLFLGLEGGFCIL